MCMRPLVCTLVIVFIHCACDWNGSGGSGKTWGIMAINNVTDNRGEYDRIVTGVNAMVLMVTKLVNG